MKLIMSEDNHYVQRSEPQNKPLKRKLKYQDHTDHSSKFVLSPLNKYTSPSPYTFDQDFATLQQSTDQKTNLRHSLVVDSEASHALSTIPVTEEDARRQKINKILNANNIDDRTKFLLLSAFKTPDSQNNDRYKNNLINRKLKPLSPDDKPSIKNAKRRRSPRKEAKSPTQNITSPRERSQPPVNKNRKRFIPTQLPSDQTESIDFSQGRIRVSRILSVTLKPNADSIGVVPKVQHQQASKHKITEESQSQVTDYHGKPSSVIFDKTNTVKINDSASTQKYSQDIQLEVRPQRSELQHYSQQSLIQDPDVRIRKLSSLKQSVEVSLQKVESFPIVWKQSDQPDYVSRKSMPQQLMESHKSIKLNSEPEVSMTLRSKHSLLKQSQESRKSIKQDSILTSQQSQQQSLQRPNQISIQQIDKTPNQRSMVSQTQFNEPSGSQQHQSATNLMPQVLRSVSQLQPSVTQIQPSVSQLNTSGFKTSQLKAPSNVQSRQQSMLLLAANEGDQHGSRLKLHSKKQSVSPDQAAKLVNDTLVILADIGKVGEAYGTGRHTESRRRLINGHSPALKESPRGLTQRTSKTVIQPKTSQVHIAVGSTVDVMSEGNSAMQRECRDFGTYAESVVEKTNKALSAKSESSVDRKSVGLSVKTQEPIARRFDACNSIMSVTQHSHRDHDGQVTEGRFEPVCFEMGCQTGLELIQDFLKPKMVTNEVETEPVLIVKSKSVTQIMIQTEPQIFEPELIHEPKTIEPKPEPLLPKLVIQLPEKENLYVMCLPAPENIINRDWSTTKLYKHLQIVYVQELIDSGLVQDIPRPQGEVRIDARHPVLTQMECEYFTTSLVKLLAADLPYKDIAVIHRRAQCTLSHLIDIMVMPEVLLPSIIAMYAESTLKNTVKLLMKAKQLYEELQLATKIYKLVIAIEMAIRPYSVLYRVLQSDKKLNRPHKAVASQFVKQISKCLQLVTNFQADQRSSFKRESQYQGNDLRLTLLQLSTVATGFLQIQEESVGGLDLDGNIIRDMVVDTGAYKKWLQDSIQKTGTLDLVPVDIKPANSRVQGVLKIIPKQVSIKQMKNRQYRPITPLEETLQSEQSYTALIQVDSQEMISPEKAIPVDKLARHEAKFGSRPVIQPSQSSMSELNSISVVDPEEGKMTRYRDKQVTIQEPHPYLSHGYSEILQAIDAEYIKVAENTDSNREALSNHRTTEAMHLNSARMNEKSNDEISECTEYTIAYLGNNHINSDQPLLVQL